MPRRTEAQWMDVYAKEFEALWIHDGSHKRPHALLTSGKHSSGFFNSKPIIAHDERLREAASDLIELFVASRGNIDVIDYVVGPQTGATKLAEYISREVTRRRGRLCGWLSPSKAGEGAVRRMVFTDIDRSLLRKKTVLLCDDVRTTGLSIDLTKDAVVAIGGFLEGSVLALANRSDTTVVGDLSIVSLFHRHMPIWSPEECPLCRAGSEAIRPKQGQNWRLLTAV